MNLKFKTQGLFDKLPKLLKTIDSLNDRGINVTWYKRCTLGITVKAGRIIKDKD